MSKARPAAMVVAGRPMKVDFSCSEGWSVARPNPDDEDGLVGQVTGALGRGEQQGRRTVCLRAAVEKPQRVAHRRRGEHLVDGYLALEVGVRVEAPVVVVLHRYRSEHLGSGPELVHVPGGEGREQDGCGLAAVVQRVAGCRTRQQALCGRLVAHLLDADHEDHLVDTGSDDHRPDAERVGSRRARILHPGERDAGSPTALGTVFPPTPSWPQRLPRWVATIPASMSEGSSPLSTLFTCRLERTGGHLLVALVEKLAELDHPGAHDGDPVPAHQTSSSVPCTLRP